MSRRLPLYCLVLLSATLVAQKSDPHSLGYFLPGSVTYDPKIPTPEAFFGFQVGEWHLQPEQIHAYVREIARLSDRIQIESMGRTYENREILLAVVTSPDNHSRISDIRATHLQLSDPTRSAGVNIASLPVVVWMGYSVHGNEASGSNASVLVAYYLAAAQGPEIDNWLKDAVILLNPSINPDGLNRFASWVDANRGMEPDPSPLSREHRETWPGGRGNHYWFDLNRDWMPLQHPESRARLAKYYAWRPNVLTDHHEMGTSATFFFQPGIPSRNNPLVPGSVQELTGRLAQFHAHALDSIGSLYYSGESFDDFYIGKGSSYPDITGGIGILFEQASARGHVQRTTGGEVSFPFAIRNHVTTSFSSIRAAIALRTELLRHQRDMAASAIDEAEKSRVKAYVFGTSEDPSRSEALARILSGHEIEVFRLGQTMTSGNQSFTPGGAFIVPVRQVQFRLLSSLFEKRTGFDDSLFYDVSAWSLPLAFGLPYAELRSFDQKVVGARFDPASDRPRTSMPARSPLYVFSWSDFYAPRVLNRLFQQGIVPRMAFEPFTASTTEGTRSFDRGAIIIAAGSQRQTQDDLRAILEASVCSEGIPLSGVTSGYTGDGIDMGSPNARVLERPRVALLAGSGVSSADAGEIWHLLDARYGMTVTLLDPENINARSLSDYNVLIMASGSYGSVGARQIEEIQAWLREGNTLVATEQAAAWVISKKLARTDLKEGENRRRDTSTVIAYNQEEPFQGARQVPGAIVSATGDATHPLLFGVNATDLFLFKSTGYAFGRSSRKSAVPIVYSQSPLVSGYLHRQSTDLFKGEGAVALSGEGRGKVILFADNYSFRAFWFGTSRIMTNAIFLGKAIEVPSSTD